VFTFSDHLLYWAPLKQLHNWTDKEAEFFPQGRGHQRVWIEPIDKAATARDLAVVFISTLPQARKEQTSAVAVRPPTQPLSALLYHIAANVPSSNQHHNRQTQHEKRAREQEKASLLVVNTRREAGAAVSE